MFLLNIDNYLFQKIFGLSGLNEVIDWMGIFFAEYLAYVLIIIAILFFVKIFSKNHRWKDIFFPIFSVVISRFFFVEIIRFFYHRPRPFLSYGFESLISHDITASFPSGHVSFFFALAICVFLLNRKLGHWFLGGSILIGLSRIFVGVHYPFDILAGIIIGVLSVLVVGMFFKKIKIINDRI